MDIKLAQPHTDAGKDYETGDIITVDEITGRWLINMKIGTGDQADSKTKVDANQGETRRRN